MHEVLFNRLGGLSLPRKSVVRLTDRPDMTIDVYHGRKTTTTTTKVTPPPTHTKYGEGYIDFVFLSVRSFVRFSVRPSIQVLIFYAKCGMKFCALSYIFESLPFRLFMYD